MLKSRRAVLDRDIQELQAKRVQTKSADEMRVLTAQIDRLNRVKQDNMVLQVKKEDEQRVLILESGK
jgi:hypothetical protein